MLLSFLGIAASALGQTPARQADPTTAQADPKTVLELAAANLQVSNQAGFSLDSALILVSGFRQINPAAVITEGFDQRFCSTYGRWLNAAHIHNLIQQLPAFSEADGAQARLLIGAWYDFQPGANNYRKAISFLKDADTLAKRLGLTDVEAQCYCLLSKAWYMLGDTAKGNSYYFTLMRDPSFDRQETIRAKAGNYTGMYYPFLSQTNNFRIHCLADALTRYQQSKDTANQVNTLMNLAYLSFASGDPQACQTYALRSLRLQEAGRFPDTQYTYDLLVFLYVNKGQSDSALHTAFAELDAATETKDEHIFASAENRIGSIYMQINNDDAAIEWYRKALNTQLAIGGDITLYRILDGLMVLTHEIGGEAGMLNTIRNTLQKFPPSNPSQLEQAYFAMSDAYWVIHNYPEARRYIRMAWKLDLISPLTKGGLSNVVLLQRMGMIDIALGDYREAKNYLTMVASKPVSISGMQLQQSIYFYLHEADSALGDYRASIRDLFMYIKAAEKVAEAKQSRQMLDLNVKYQAIQRQKQLQELETKNRLQLQSIAFTTRLFYGGFAFLGFVIVMLYARHRNNRRKNRQLNAQKQAIDEQNLALQELNRGQTQLLEEKEWLLREIHHRVKNNLQIITSLLVSQSEFLRDQNAVEIMLDSQRRVQTMSLIHQKLYNSANLSSIYMPEYIGELVDYLKESFIIRQKVVFHLHIDNLRLDVSKAVPLGLILNEVITNAFKYAFSYSGNDLLTIRLTPAGDWIVLEVQDNGKGLPPDFDLTASNSFGMVLMKGMAEDLEGTFTVESNEGTRVIIRFRNLASNKNGHVLS
jgi:two-component sensor histidine kinase/tetratricopeptide (TPR) repeat protein